MVLLKIDDSDRERAGLSMAEHAHELLVAKVVELEFPPGTPLLERDLMESLNLGRTPIREALHRLSNEGLVCRLPHHGVYVCEVTPDSVTQLYELRLMVDGRVAELAAKRASESSIIQIISAAKALEISYRESDLASFTANGRRFWETMARASKNIHIMEIMPRMYNLDARLTYIANQVQGSWDILGHGIVETALSLAGTVRRGLAGESRLLAELHVERRYQYFLQLMQAGASETTQRESPARRLA
jgi:DNA-binding GntR family transcriptional regulator